VMVSMPVGVGGTGVVGYLILGIYIIIEPSKCLSERLCCGFQTN
jgi:hypothetical protein